MERYYTQGEYPVARRLLLAVQQEPMRAPDMRYAFLRGMVELRLGNDSEARYWLNLAETLRQTAPSDFPPAWQADLQRARHSLSRALQPGQDFVQVIE